MNEPLIVLENVTIRVPREESFTGISFRVNRGEHWAFVGENEALKNALIDALAGNAAVFGGRADFPFFEAIKAEPEKDPFLSPFRLIAKIADRHSFRNLANTSQFYYQQRFNAADADDALTVQEYLENSQSATGLEAVVARLKLAPLLDKTLIKLSHGETKRLLIAAALLREPQVLLLVNPFAGLDVATRKELRDLLNEIAADTTLVLSTTPDEIPEAITHLATFDTANRILTSRKEDLAAGAPALPKEAELDAAELASLLALGHWPLFRDIVVMKNVCIQYGDRRVLRNINWTVRQGERWALLGPNGAGKSTLLSLINGDNPQAFANDIILFDRKKGSGESIWDIKQKTGFFSPELYQYFPLQTTCLEAVESGFYDTIGLFRPSHPELAAIALRWMNLLGLGRQSQKMLSQVSAVDQRLCLLARALVKSPPLLILDEPCQGFPPEKVRAFRRLVNAICAAGNTTLIYVTHYSNEIPEAVNRIFRLEDGRQVTEADPPPVTGVRLENQQE